MLLCSCISQDSLGTEQTSYIFYTYMDYIIISIICLYKLYIIICFLNSVIYYII